LVLTDLKYKLSREYCDKKQTQKHKALPWEKTEDHGWYIVLAKKCKFCGKILKEEVMK